MSSQNSEYLSGTVVSNAVLTEITEEVKSIVSNGLPQPRLDVIIVGDRKDSATYVRMKEKACERAGISHQTHRLPADITQSELDKVVRELGENKDVHGILVQLPLPDHLVADTIIEAIPSHKDVDGLTTANAGILFRDGHKAPMIPCTPLGCIKLLEHYKISAEGKHAVVIGRSNLVGKPISLLLQSLNATVTMCHSRTKDLAAVVKEADIVVAAVGRANFVKGSWIRPGATVIDVGINPIPDSTKASGVRLVGDVDFNEVKEVTKLVTPVPGGVGPMTVAMLMRNTLSGYYLAIGDGVKAQIRADVEGFKKSLSEVVLGEEGKEEEEGELHSQWKRTHKALNAFTGKKLPVNLVELLLRRTGCNTSHDEQPDEFVRLVAL